MIYTIEKRHVFGCYDGSYMQSHYEVIAHTHRLPNGCLASTGALTVHTCKYKREATAYCKATASSRSRLLFHPKNPPDDGCMAAAETLHPERRGSQPQERSIHMKAKTYILQAGSCPSVRPT